MSQESGQCAGRRRRQEEGLRDGRWQVGEVQPVAVGGHDVLVVEVNRA